MQREIVITADGSTTIHLPEWNEQYHSKHGAIKEAYHVFIKHGLYHYCHIKPEKISILEIGFGTGLNALITLLEAQKLNVNIDYFGVEGYPISNDEINLLNYHKALDAKAGKDLFNKLHELSWEESHKVTTTFSLIKLKKLFHQIDDINSYNIIYFDAFGARVQPELWTEKIFTIMYNALKTNGILVTYSAKGSVRRAMEAVGFKVERLPGPPGKREMLRACKVV